MKFHTLSIQNFLALSNATVNLADRGLQLLQGENEDNTSADSNGAGKSSIVDAISWCLFGLTARGTKGDKVVNRTKKKDCIVSMSVSNGASEYVIARGRKHATLKNSLVVEAVTPGGRVAMTKGTDAETQKVVEQILGCSYEVFKAAIYAGQEEMPDLPRKTDKELKTLIEEAAGLQRIERAYEIARARRTDKDKVLQAVEVKLTTLAANAARTEKQLEEATSQAAVWEMGRGVRVTEATEQVKAAAEELKRQAVQLGKRKAEYDAAVDERAKIDKQLAEHGELERTAMAKESEYHRLDRAIDRSGLVAAKKAVDDCEAAIANPDEFVGRPCEACGKPGDENDKAHFLEHKQGQLELLKRKLNEKKSSVTLQVAAAAAAKRAAEAARAVVPDVSAAAGRRSELTTFVRAYDSDKQAVLRQKTTVDSLSAVLEQRKTEANPHDKLVETLRKQVTDLAGEVAAATTARDAAKVELLTAEDVVRVFGPAGVRAEILDTVTPYLNDRTSDYLSVLTDGNTKAVWTTLSKSASGDLKEKFSIEVTDDQGGDNFADLSGGEKRKVRIATALALQDLVASRATQPIDLWIGDEIDDALDKAGLERLMTILERKARERGTVLVISHNDLKDWCDEVTLVRKSGGTSVVEGSLCS